MYKPLIFLRYNLSNKADKAELHKWPWIWKFNEKTKEEKGKGIGIGTSTAKKDKRLNKTLPDKYGS